MNESMDEMDKKNPNRSYKNKNRSYKLEVVRIVKGRVYTRMCFPPEVAETYGTEDSRFFIDINGQNGIQLFQSGGRPPQV